MMEGCNTGLQTIDILLDTHFPGSTPMDQSLCTTSGQVEVNDTSPDNDAESLQTTWPEQVANGEVSHHQYNIVLDKYLDNDLCIIFEPR